MANKKDWYDREEFWKTFKSSMFSAKKREEASKEVEDIISLLKIRPKKHILDLCCGVGRHSIGLAKHGFNVTGVDRTALYLEEARKRAKGLKLEFIQNDMRNFCRPGAFDGAICMFTSFGFFDDRKDDRKVVENVYKSLKPKGKFIIETMGKEILARIFRERMWSRGEDGTIFMQEHKIIDNWEKIENKWIIIKGKKRTEFDFSLRLYSGVELSQLLKECGFKKVEGYGTLDGTPYDQNAQKLVTVAEKT
ncbi:MAG: class I SAM-dependent methyltransferase [bacterium]|nr:class I SAM-dependent methyltransferase [bacterium]